MVGLFVQDFELGFTVLGIAFPQPPDPLLLRPADLPGPQVFGRARLIVEQLEPLGVKASFPLMESFGRNPEVGGGSSGVVLPDGVVEDHPLQALLGFVRNPLLAGSAPPASASGLS